MPGPATEPARGAQRVVAVVAALAASLLLLFLAVPIGKLIGAGGSDGVRQLFTDAELRQALGLTAVTATRKSVV